MNYMLSTISIFYRISHNSILIWHHDNQSTNSSSSKENTGSNALSRRFIIENLAIDDLIIRISVAAEVSRLKGENMCTASDCIIDISISETMPARNNQNVA